MQPLIVSPGDMFSRLTVVREAESRHSHRVFECRCECGATKTVFLSALRSGLSKSCGCLRDEIATRHGKHKTPEYRIWAGMISRCENRKLRSWKNYGGRGISICPEWRASFEAFFAHAGIRPSARHSIDRFPNNDGDYEPGNVRWATMSEQLRNNRRSRRAEAAT